jgi:AmmeMemoRadiSam system protein B
LGIDFYIKKLFEARMRESAFSGMFYEKDPVLLEKQIKTAFAGKMGPGALPIEKRAGKIAGVISPHAGYSYSGMCAAWAYKAIAEAEMPDVFIILGTGHTGFGSGISLEDWKTPFGIVKNDRELAKSIIEKGELLRNEDAHLEEHSIEVQLPFLQFASRKEQEKLRIVPVVVSEDINYREAALQIKNSILESGKSACIIASSDFTHYGPNYGFLPFFDNAKENIKKIDFAAIDRIIRADADGFIGYVERTGATICGALSIAVMMLSAGFKKAEMLQYYTSGELTGDYKNSVSYASMTFR